MAQFPKSEQAIGELANDIATGFTENPTIYPAPPVSSLDLTVLMHACIDAHNASVAAQAAAEQTTTDKDEAFWQPRRCDEVRPALCREYG